MKSTIIVLCFAIGVFWQPSTAQVRTEETRKTVTATGDTVVTQAIVVSQSEDITPRKGIIFINPIKFILFYNLSFMLRASPGVALGGGLQSPTLAGIEGWGINAEIRLHPSGKSPRGFYVAPNFSYSDLRSGKSSSTPTSVGVLVGWQWFPGEEFAIGLGIGIDHYYGSVSTSGDDFGRYDGNVPAIRFDIGYAW